jgi:hypothetical protein
MANILGERDERGIGRVIEHFPFKRMYGDGYTSINKEIEVSYVPGRRSSWI